jgi:anti-sigma B factor antagonist
MDSSGLGELISCYTTLQRMSGRIKLLHLSDRLQHLLVITKLTSVFETFDSEPEAVASFAHDLKERRLPDENTQRNSPA